MLGINGLAQCVHGSMGWHRFKTTDQFSGHLHIVDVELIVVSRDSQKNAQTSPDFSNLHAVN